MKESGKEETVIEETLRIARTIKRHLSEPNCQHSIMEIAAEALQQTVGSHHSNSGNELV